MKKIIVFLLFSFLGICMCAESTESDDFSNMLGLGVATITRPYVGVDAETIPTPIIFWKYENFIVEGTKVGYIIAQGDHGGSLDVFIAPRFMGYESDDDPFLNGMRDRDYSLDAGFQVKVNCPYVDDAYFGLSLSTDILSKHDGQEISLFAAKKFRHKYYMIKPKFGLRWQSSNMIDYYYGVEGLEARTGRTAYGADATVNCFFSVDFGVGLSESLRLIGQCGIEALGNEIQDSPLVDENYILSFVLGIAKEF